MIPYVWRNFVGIQNYGMEGSDSGEHGGTQASVKFAHVEKLALTQVIGRRPLPAEPVIHGLFFDARELQGSVTRCGPINYFGVAPERR